MKRGLYPMLGLFLLLSACSTQKPVRLLAERTAANAGVLSAQLKMLAQDSNDLADLRSTNIARLHAANAHRRANYNYDIALTRRSGAGRNLDLVDLLEDWGRKVDEIFKAADNAEKERKAAILATQTALDPKSTSLAEIAQGLAALAQEESSAERAEFLASYARQVRDEIEIQLDQNEASAIAAKKLLAEVKDKL